MKHLANGCTELWSPVAESLVIMILIYLVNISSTVSIIMIVLLVILFYVLGIFDSIDCHTLFLPATKRILLQDLSKVSRMKYNSVIN